MDALFDFPLHFQIRDAFARGGPLREVARMLARDHVYRDPSSLVTLLGLHDVGRFIAHCKLLLRQDCGLAVFGTNSEAN